MSCVGRGGMVNAHKYLEFRGFETYYFASAVRNILHDQFGYLRDLDDFYGDGKHFSFAQPFSKFSAFHCFIEFVVSRIIYDKTCSIDMEQIRRARARDSHIPKDHRPKFYPLPVSRALDYYGIEHTTFDQFLLERGESENADANEDRVYDYYESLLLEGPLDLLLERVVDEVFFVLFSNRSLLSTFNEMLASVMSMSHHHDGIVPSEYRDYFKKNGTLERVHIPKWVQNAVFFRDRGRCTICKTDVSGLAGVGGGKNFDHIVPLGLYGLNDVSNIQLLCSPCNQDKGARNTDTSNLYEMWY